MKVLAYALAGALLLGTAGCPKDEYDPQTWVDKLDEPAEAAEALQRLQQLKDPRAIKPLGKFWRKKNYPSKVLRIIIDLAGHIEHDIFLDGKKIDSRATMDRVKRVESEVGEIVRLQTALKSETNDRRKANLQQQLKEKKASLNIKGEVSAGAKVTWKATKGPTYAPAVPFLIEAIDNFDIGDQQSIDDASVAADALGLAIDSGVKSPEAVTTLINAAKKKMPKLSPGQRVRIAAVRSLGKLGPQDRSVDTLVEVLETPIEKQPIKVNAAAANALADAAHPRSVQPLLLAMFRIPPIYQQVRTALTAIGKPVEPELIKIFEGKHDAINAYAKEENFTEKAPGALKFNAATLLGDMRVRSAVPMLIKALKEEAKPSFFDPQTGQPGPTTHNAILDALRKIGDPKAADAVYDYWHTDGIKVQSKAIAIDVWSMLEPKPSEKQMSELEAIFSNKDEDQDLRLSSAMAYGRMAYKKSHVNAIQAVINKEFKGPADEADKKAKAETDPDKKADYEAERDSRRSYQVTFEEYVYRAEVGVECKDDPACYAKYLEADDIRVGSPGLARAERALLQIRKLGDKAKGVLPALLEHAASTERIVREGVLFALTSVAPAPCAECKARLEEVIGSQKDQTTLDYLTSDTRIVMFYYRSNSGG